jgi:hypothetical protein
LNQGRRGGKPATNRLSYGAAKPIVAQLFKKQSTFSPQEVTNDSYLEPNEPNPHSHIVLFKLHFNIVFLSMTKYDDSINIDS